MLHKRKVFSPPFPAVSLALMAAALPLSAQTERTVTMLAAGVYEIQHRELGGGRGFLCRLSDLAH